MDIPESIQQLTTETVLNNFAVVETKQQFIFDNIIEQLRQQVDFQNHKSFNEGIAFYKQNVMSDRSFIKNFFNLYIETITKSINSSTISEDYKGEVLRAYTGIVKNAVTSIEAIHSLTNTLNKGENFIDVQKIHYIILGYAIDAIKKINELRA